MTKLRLVHKPESRAICLKSNHQQPNQKILFYDGAYTDIEPKSLAVRKIYNDELSKNSRIEQIKPDKSSPKESWILPSNSLDVSEQEFEIISGCLQK